MFYNWATRPDLGALAGSLTVTGGTLDLHSFSPTVGSSLSGNAGGMITTQGVTASSTLTSNSIANTTYAGTITNGGAVINFVKSGSGTLTLSSTGSNYTGATTVNAGTLEFKTIANVNSGVNTSLGNPAPGNGQINIGAAGPATLRFIGTNASTNRS